MFLAGVLEYITTNILLLVVNEGQEAHHPRALELGDREQ